MKRILVTYASVTGNTEAIAEYIAEGMKEMNVEVEMKDSLCVVPEELKKYDGILLGSYSWDGIPDEFMDVYEGIKDLNLNGKKAAVFGSGDTMYGEEFCIAVEQIDEQLKKSGAEIVLEGLKIKLMPENEDITRCKEYGRQFVQKLK